ncbi:structure-specific endonuclease subunit SLX4 isoform X2 [Onychostoma macrolepis]|uniref:structure-specific endonuclease subunit SLX4 isoform X2 n=1 Tax=Onychostoma macrolepis TaxID=369639 RepID=UPI00272D72BE|nr:structure-specific endonuclease subunit SLX4 isoform X2 [Onychostoma macrolepis]
MDDSDQDFTDLCSRLLKRVRKKGAGGSGDEKRSATKDEEPSSPISRRNPPKRRKKTDKDVTKTEVKSKIDGRTQAVGSGDVSQPVPEVSGTGKVKDAVIRRMQQFKRASPERLLHAETDQPTTTQSDGNRLTTAGMQLTDVSSDEALALQLQQELDREARPTRDVEDEGLFFCQLCQKDLSAMSPPLRTQHINRCLDASESSAPSASHHSHPRPRLPECPICGKSFKSEKSRSVHLKRCSSDMGVKPNDLLQALRRQAAETASACTSDQSQQLGSGTVTRRDGKPVKKRTRRKAQKVDEDTMVALALSRSLLQQEMEKEREMAEEKEILAQLSSPPATGAHVLQWKPGAGKGRGKRRKGASPVHPPLLLIQDPQTALNRLQERVSSLLLRSRPPSPPTPTLSPSVLPLHPQAPLWDKSALHGGGPDAVSEFYTSELSNFIQPWVAPEREKVESLEVTPVKKFPAEADSVQEKLSDQSPAQHQTTRPLTPCSGTPDTQALQDLMELAEEGMTLTQYGYTMYTVAGNKSDNAVNELPSSGFVPVTNDKKMPKKTPVYVSKLASDLSCMVNNPQLSDVQLQVDSGDVFFTHSFMLYTRCPLLANMVHDSGFGVQEEGMPVSQRVLLGNVLGEAVLALLQYLYTAHCPLTHTLLPHILELSDRFGLAELQQQCEEYSGSVEENPTEESEGIFPAPKPHLGDQEDQNLAESNFLDLLQSMWQHGDSEEEDDFKETAREERDMEEEQEREDGEKEDRVDEEELDEIYDFAATQRKMETMLEAATETEEEEGDANTSLGNEKDETEDRSETESLLEKSAGSCHSNKQGVDGMEAAMVTSPREETLENPNLETERVCFISELDENRDPDASLDKSYDRLFSQSVGEYMEPSQTPASCSQQQCYKPSRTLQQNTPAPFRPSCVSEVIDLSISPPPSSGVSGETNFPMPGVSPVPHEGEHAGKSPLTKDNSVCQKIENPASPPQSQSKQVELIVLSDSGDEMDVDGGHNAATTKRALTPPSPFESPSEPLQTSTSYACKVTENTFKESGSQGHAGKRVDTSKQVSTDTEARSERSEHCSPGIANESVFDGSAEVSWLIPATPVPSTRCSSAQTCISMRRTQLFPKSSSSSSSSSVSSGLKPVSFDSSSSSSCIKAKPVPFSELPKSNSSPSKEHRSSDTDRSPGYRRPLRHLRLSQVPSTDVSDGSHIGSIKGHPTQGVSKPSSSTPLHSDSSLQRQIPFGSPVVDDCEVRLRDSRGNSRFFGSQGKVGLASLQLSYSSPSKAPEKKQSSSLAQGCSSPSPNFQSCSHPERSRKSNSDGVERMELGENPNQNYEELVDIAENSFSDMDEPGRRAGDENQNQSVDELGDIAGDSLNDMDGSGRAGEENPNQSFDEVVDIAGNSFCGMDEPPIAFDDSWGLDGGVGSQKPCFSLRLDSSDGMVSPPGLKGKGPTSTSPLASGACTKTPDPSPGPFNHSLPDPDMWDDWEEEEVASLPLSQRLTAPSAKRVAELKTPVACRKKNKGPLVPITPMPGFSDMDTPELKNKLNRFGVRPLPKKQMVLKLKEIHQYTHQLQSSESEEETFGPQRPPNASNSQSAPLSFKQPTAPSVVSPVKLPPSEEDELLSASQNSNTSSTAESDRSNPELCVSEDEDSDSEGITASQAVVREKDKLLAVRQFILSDPKLYARVLQYQPLSLAELQSSLKAAGIRLGAAKLLDFLDSQCITFSTAKQGQNASSRRKRRVKTTTSGGAAGRGRKKAAKPNGGVA